MPSVPSVPSDTSPVPFGSILSHGRSAISEPAAHQGVQTGSCSQDEKNKENDREEKNKESTENTESTKTIENTELLDQVRIVLKRIQIL